MNATNFFGFATKELMFIAKSVDQFQDFLEMTGSDKIISPFFKSSAKAFLS